LKFLRTRPRLFGQTKTKTVFFVLEASTDQDLGSKDYITVINQQQKSEKLVLIN